MVPTEWEELALAFAQRVGDVWHTYTYAYYLVFLIDNNGHKVEVQNREIHVAVVFLLALGEGLEVIEFLVCYIYNVHVLCAVFLY